MQPLENLVFVYFPCFLFQDLLDAPHTKNEKKESFESLYINDYIKIYVLQFGIFHGRTYTVQLLNMELGYIHTLPTYTNPSTESWLPEHQSAKPPLVQETINDSKWGKPQNQYTTFPLITTIPFKHSRRSRHMTSK